MPSAIKYVPPTDNQRHEWNSSLLHEKQERQRLYSNALLYYDGEHPDQLEVDPDEPDDNVYINLVKMGADRTASFLFSEMPQFSTDPKSVEETDEEKWLRKFFEFNGGLALLTKLATRGFLAGHNFVRVLPPRNKWDKYPKLVLLNPIGVTVYWKDDDVGDILWYEYRYREGTAIMIKDFVANPEKERWEIYTYRSVTGDPNEANPLAAGVMGIPGPHGSEGDIQFVSQLFADGHGFEKVDGVAYHTSRIPPIVEWAHLPDPDNYYGQSEAGQLDLQDTINRVWSQITRIIREHSDPKDVATGADVDEIEQYGDNFYTIPNAASRVQRLELKGDLSAAIDTVNKLVETYLSTIRVVILKGEAKDLQRVTNASVRTLFLDMLAKNEQLRAAYGTALKAICVLALQMAKGDKAPLADDLEIEIKYANPLPTDQTEIANVNTLGIHDGYMSQRTAATRLALNYAFEREAITTETKENLEAGIAEQKAMIDAGVTADPTKPPPGSETEGKPPPKKKTPA